ncbi:hypothetical protein OHS58_48530 [Amycolatopsis sp. NBC_00348]|uniref:hypothetical protein n=1 Tax=unclassified Amycolatopsis TaxID=2618356 RepID=UPI002E258822|nr:MULTISPECIES: hypothetical protein [unclassified Amycolatopsis]
MSLTTTTATTSPATVAVTDDEPYDWTSFNATLSVTTTTVRMANQIASGAYHQAGQSTRRLVRLLPEAQCPDDRMRLLYVLAAEENHLAALFPAVHPTQPQRWQDGVSAHQLAGEVAGMIATAEEAIASRQPYRPGGFELETGYVADLMNHYPHYPAPAERAAVVDALGRHLAAHGYPARAVELADDIAAGLRVAAVFGNRAPAFPAP